MNRWFDSHLSRRILPSGKQIKWRRFSFYGRFFTPNCPQRPYVERKGKTKNQKKTIDRISVAYSRSRIRSILDRKGVWRLECIRPMSDDYQLYNSDYYCCPSSCCLVAGHHLHRTAPLLQPIIWRRIPRRIQPGLVSRSLPIWRDDNRWYAARNHSHLRGPPLRIGNSPRIGNHHNWPHCFDRVLHISL